MRKSANVVVEIAKRFGSELCVKCKGSKLLCGKSRCPILVRYYHMLRVSNAVGKEMQGSTPPSVFVGRAGYPKVNVGPLLPPVHGNTEIYDLPEVWIDKAIDEFVRIRTMLVRGKIRIRVDDVDSPVAQKMVDIALSKSSMDMEVVFKKRPKSVVVLDDDVQPYGPSAPIEMFNYASEKWDTKMEKVHYDTDMRAADALVYLYREDVPVSKIQRALSVGAFGVEKRRRMVPTRWAITAVDSTISLYLLDKVKDYPTIDDYRVYHSNNFENSFVVMMIPRAWSYELIEAWYPNTVWNPFGKEIFMISDYEKYNGRWEYAQIGGCYYAARLSVCEALERERKQAKVVVLREARPGYIMPVGVWQVRENVRRALKKNYASFDCLEDALKHAQRFLKIPIRRFVNNSALLSEEYVQRRIEDFR